MRRSPAWGRRENQNHTTRAKSRWLQPTAEYTRHTVKHSDAIVLQMSKLLFREGDAAQPVLNLSPMEAYIAAASAYLHDAGMVTSEKEKSEILVSDSWKEWTADGSGSERLGQIEAFRKGGDPADPTLRHFIADRQTRFRSEERRVGKEGRS